MQRCRTGRLVVLFALALVLFQAGAVAAQDAAEETVEPQRRVVAWTNPILFVFTWYMLEAEIRLAQNHTVGIGGSYLQTNDGDKDDLSSSYEETEYFSWNVFYRYYPSESFKGFFIGGQLGSANVGYKYTPAENDPFDEAEDESGTAMLAGVLIGYGWLLGDAERVGVSLGIGANRFFGGDVPDDASTTLPVVRLINVGIAF